MLSRIFPTNLSISDEDAKVRKRVQDFYDASFSQNSESWSEASIDSELEAGKASALKKLGFSRFPEHMDFYTSNKIKRAVSMLSGVQRQNRKSTNIVPVEYANQETADQLTKIITAIHNDDSVLQTISDSYTSANIAGLSLLQVWVDYRNDAISGNIKVDMCPYNSFIIDPFFKKADLSDCSAIWKRTYMTKEEASSLLPEYEEDINDMEVGRVVTDDLFPFMASSILDRTNFVSYDEFYYKDTRKQRKLINKVTGKSIEYNDPGTDDNADELLSYWLRNNPEYDLKEEYVPTVRTAILVDGIVFYHGLNPLGIDEYPFVPVFSIFNQNLNDLKDKCVGVVRGMRDSQFLYNMAMSLEVEYVQSRINPITKYKPTSLVNPKAIKKRDFSKGLEFKRNSSLADVEFSNPLPIPNSIPLLKEQAEADLTSIVGNNEVMAASTGDNIAGITEAFRQATGRTITQPILDSLDRTQKLLGKVELLTIQSNYTPGKVERITGEQPTEEFYNKTFGRYDAVVTEGYNTETQRQQQFAQMMTLQQRIPEAISNEQLIKASTLENKTEIIEQMQQASQIAQQKEQEVEQINMRLQQAETLLAEAKANSDNAKAAESYSRIQDNRTQALENLAEADKDREQAALNEVKALKELQGMDLDNLVKFIDVLRVIKQETGGNNANNDSSVKGIPGISAGNPQKRQRRERILQETRANQQGQI